MNAPKAGEGSIFQPRNHPQHLCLGPVFHFSLKADDIIQCSQLVIAAQLHHGIGFGFGIMGVGQAYGLHRTKSQGFATPFCHHFDRKTAVKVAGGFAFFKFGFIGGQERVDERLVLILGHRAIEVSSALFLGFALVIARLHPRFAHVDAVVIDNRRDGVEKGQRLGTGLGCNRLRHITRGQRAGRNNPVAVAGQVGDLSVFDRNIGVRHQRIRH